MITALNVEVPDKGRGIIRLINSLKRDKYEISLNRARGVCLKKINVRTYSGRVKLDKLDCILGANHKNILCPDNIKFPIESGFHKFESDIFASRLCTNMGLEILRNCHFTDDIHLGIYDTNGNSADFLLYALKYCSNITIITNAREIYSEQLDRAMNELGATAVISDKDEDLTDCNFIIAPEIINHTLPIKSESVVLTNRKPSAYISASVYYNYIFKVPNGFDKIKPAELSDEYFCSALYILENQYELGSIIPKMCCNSSVSQTVKSLSAYMDTFKSED